MAWLAALIAAPFVGSFLGVLIRRLPAGRSVTIARSACEACGHVLAPNELIPIVSFVVQRGRCRRCEASIAPMHLAVELAALAVAAVACAILADPVALWLGAGLGWALLALAWIGAEHRKLPDGLTLPLILAGLAATWLREPHALLDHGLAAALGYVALRALASRVAVLRRHMGGGDAKLFAAAGAWTGLLGLPLVLLGTAAATLGGAAISRPRGARALPLAPAIALAVWILWLWQQGLGQQARLD